jgi:hypothetical protein
MYWDNGMTTMPEIVERRDAIGTCVKEMTENLGWKKKVTSKVTLVGGVNIMYGLAT